MPPRKRVRPPATGALTPNPQPLMTTEAPAAVQTRKRGRELVDPVYLSARIEREVRDDFQRQAIAERRSVGELLDSAVREYLDRHRQTD